MVINKTKNTARNVVFGSILKIYQILLPFVFRTIMIKTLGAQYLGLNSLFTSVLQVLNLAELGVGSAMIFSMYKPIVDDDKNRICALMKLYLIYYRIIGVIILCAGLICTPFIPHLIHGTVPKEMNVYILYLLNLGATVLTYWLFAYKNSIIQAYQRQDVVSKVTIVTDTCKYLMQLVALVYFKNYYFYVISILISQVLANISTAIASQILYPQYKPKGKLPKEEIKVINQRIKDLFTSKLGGTIVGSADTIVISAFLGLELLAMYQNYYYILSACMAFITIINNSIVAGIGNSMLTKSIKENYKDFKTFSFVQFWILGFCICCFSALYQPFMTLWMGKKMLFEYPVIILLCIYFLGNELLQMFSVYKDAAGIWHEDRFRPLISGFSNLLINLILVKFIGIYGIILSTVLSIFCISLPWIIHNVFTLVFKNESIKEYVKNMLFYIIIIFIATVLVNFICSFIHCKGIILLIIRALICVIIPNVLFICVYHKRTEFNNSINVILRMLPIRRKKLMNR